MTDQASIDTRIYGNPDDIREVANKLYTVYESLDTLSGQFKSKLRTNFYAWDGEAAHSTTMLPSAWDPKYNNSQNAFTPHTQHSALTLNNSIITIATCNRFVSKPNTLA